MMTNTYEKLVFGINIIFLITKVVAFAVTLISSLLALAIDSGCDLCFSILVSLYHRSQNLMFIQTAVYSCMLTQLIPLTTLLMNIVKEYDYDIGVKEFIIAMTIICAQGVVKILLFLVCPSSDDVGIRALKADQLYDSYTSFFGVITLLVIYLSNRTVALCADYTGTILIVVLTVFFWGKLSLRETNRTHDLHNVESQPQTLPVAGSASQRSQLDTIDEGNETVNSPEHDFVRSVV